jgi:DNA helicase-2/ATP-dependent DNA helicase PcrA
LRKAAGELGVTQLSREVLLRTAYMARFRPDDIEDQSRKENVLELIGSIEQLERELNEQSASASKAEPKDQSETGPGDKLFDLFDDTPSGPLTLGDYLTRVALATGDDLGEGVRGVQLMTAHAAKGLEFQVVLVTGLEDGLFPSLRTGNDSEAEREQRLAEERRLCYVAMTRARERLFLSYAYTRRLFGMQPRLAPVSRFVRDIPPECLDRTVEYEPPSRSTPRRPAFATHHPRADNVEVRPDSETSVDPKEMRVEYEPDESQGRLRVGMPVRHQEFGTGHIQSVAAWHGTVTVQFENGLKRTLQARYLFPVLDVTPD